MPWYHFTVSFAILSISMGKIIGLGKVFLAICLIFILAVVVKYADSLRSTAAIFSKSKVAGAKTSLEQEMKDNLSGYTLNAKKQIMNIKLGDIVNSFGRITKISNDISNVKDYLLQKGQKLYKR